MCEVFKVKYTYDENKKKIKFELNEDIDMESCKSLRTIVDGYIMRYSPIECEIDFSNVKFMDSSGLGFITGRYNLTRMLGCNLVITNPDSNIKKILDMYQGEKKIRVVNSGK